MNQLLAIEQATVAGDVSALRAAFGNPSDFPNVQDELGQSCLGHAICRGPVALVRVLLDLGADPDYPDAEGFPSLFAAIDRSAPDRHEVLELLLTAGANVQQRGVSDCTALHYAACRNDAAAVEILLRYGADPDARTRIDQYATPLEEAELLGFAIGAAALRRWKEAGKPGER